MKLDRFLAYLDYRDCFPEQTHQTFSIFRSRETGQTVSVITKSPEIHANNVVQACRALGIPSPDVDNIKEVERRLAIIWPQ